MSVEQLVDRVDGHRPLDPCFELVEVGACYVPLLPLALLLFSGLYLFALPYATKWRGGRPRLAGPTDLPPAPPQMPPGGGPGTR